MDVIDKLFKATHELSPYLYFEHSTLYHFEESGTISIYTEASSDFRWISCCYLSHEVPLEVLLTSEYKEWQNFAKERL